MNWFAEEPCTCSGNKPKQWNLILKLCARTSHQQKAAAAERGVSLSPLTKKNLWYPALAPFLTNVSNQIAASYGKLRVLWDVTSNKYLWVDWLVHTTEIIMASFAASSVYDLRMNQIIAYAFPSYLILRRPMIVHGTRKTCRKLLTLQKSGKRTWNGLQMRAWRGENPSSCYSIQSFLKGKNSHVFFHSREIQTSTSESTVLLLSQPSLTRSNGCREKMPGARLVDLCGIRHRVLDIDVCGIRYALLARSRRLWVCFVDVSSVLMHQEVIRDKSSGPECSYHSIDAYEFSKKKKPCKRNASVLDFLAVVCVEVQWLL